jgi:hypothetical protein
MRRAGWPAHLVWATIETSDIEAMLLARSAFQTEINA